DDAVDRVLEHEQAVTDAQCERTTASALADHGGHDRDVQARHLAQVARDGLRLPALLRADAGVGAGGVDERDDRTAELVRKLHEPECLAVPFGMRHSEVAPQVLLHVAALLVTDQHDGLAVQARPAAYDRLVVAAAPI